MKHIFHIYHPATVFFYIMAAVIFSMVTQNPVCIVISFLAASGYSIHLNGIKKYLKTLRFIAVLFIIISIMNPIFNQNGITILFYLFGNPVTKEACLYGFASAGMLSCILVWFTCYNSLIPNEKFLYLFGRIMPTLALMLSMILRLIPVTRYKIRCINNASRALGAKAQSKKQRIAHGVRSSSILMSWMMEDSIETTESMNSRGYGCTKRTSFMEYKWTAHDIAALIIMLVFSAVAVYMMIAEFSKFTYYPIMGGELFSSVGILGYILYAVLLCFPLILELRETIRWK